MGIAFVSKFDDQCASPRILVGAPAPCGNTGHDEVDAWPIRFVPERVRICDRAFDLPSEPDRRPSRCTVIFYFYGAFFSCDSHRDRIASLEVSIASRSRLIGMCLLFVLGEAVIVLVGSCRISRTRLVRIALSRRRFSVGSIIRFLRAASAMMITSDTSERTEYQNVLC